MSSVGVMFPGSSQCYMNVAPSSARLFWSSANFLILIKAVLLSGMGHNGFEQILPSVKPNFISLSHIEVSPKKAFSFAFFIVVWYEDGKLPVISITVSVLKSCTPTRRWKPPALLLWASQGPETSVSQIMTYGNTILLIKGARNKYYIIWRSHGKAIQVCLSSSKQPHRNLMSSF